MLPNLSPHITDIKNEMLLPSGTLKIAPSNCPVEGLSYIFLIALGLNLSFI